MRSKPVEFKYRKVASSKTSRLEARAGFFRLLMKGIFDPYVNPAYLFLQFNYY